jgi:MYXO-CTERM domain-containing protein
MLRAASLSIVFVLLAPLAAHGATLYVDGTLSKDCAGTYAPASRTCSGGTATAYADLNGGAGAAKAGDTVQIRGGTYQEQLVPSSSGAAGQPVTFKPFGKEKVTISGLGKPALYIVNRSYITVEALTVTNVQGWGRIESCKHCVIRGNHFSKATSTGTTGGLKLVKSSYLQILNNTFEDGNDNVVVQESDHNLLAGNTFTKGRHSLLSVRCGNYNVFRSNTFNNPDQKAAEIYDCEGVSDAPIKLDATKRNLFEWNTFVHTRAHATKHYYYNGIQYAGQLGIVRRNVFYDNQGGALGIQVYSDEALHNYGHRIYNNTIHDNRCYGISASNTATSSKYKETLVKNNILYKNSDCSGAGGQTQIGNTTAVALSSNAITATSPKFVNAAGHDFHLLKGSPMVDKAAFLTTTVGAGKGKKMVVADAAYFFDGNGIQGLQGDLIQLEGQTSTARVLTVDLGTNTLTLDAEVTWKGGQKLALAYHGAAPDMGAFEYTPAGVKLDGSMPGDASAGIDVASPLDGGQADAAPGADGTLDGLGTDASDTQRGDDGCGCFVASPPASGGITLLMLLAFVLAFLSTRKR